MTSSTGFETRLLLNDGRVVPAAVAWDGSQAACLIDVVDGMLRPRRVLPHGTVDGLGFILNATQRALIADHTARH